MRRLSASHSENDQWQLTLSVSLEDAAAARLNCGYRDTALRDYSESLDTRRRLNTVGPPDADRLRDLCLTLEATANLNDGGTALGLYEESFSFRRQLAKPKDSILIVQTNIWERSRESPTFAALAAMMPALLPLTMKCLSPSCRTVRAGRYGAAKNVWSDLDKITDLRLSAGDFDEALTASEESLTISQKLTSARGSRI